ncbi:hypothetical protein F5884DRAFT_861317 [Xylogone sp. PMI_703]|nr:hypothetical protein F5884DRAFT_861317 [Xylogone sp. PMI_703]
MPTSLVGDSKEQSIRSDINVYPNGDAIVDLAYADEALAFLKNHPSAGDLAVQGSGILEDPEKLKRLIWKIDSTIIPLLAVVFFLQFLDKTTLSYAAIMGIRTDVHLVGQDYSNT